MAEAGRYSRLMFVKCDSADCYYRPETGGAVRITPPYGTQVQVVDQQGDWIAIKWFNKVGWVDISKLSARAPDQRNSPFELRIVPGVTGYPSIPGPHMNASSYFDCNFVETGPRGGRFTRTKSGHRRYF